MSLVVLCEGLLSVGHEPAFATGNTVVAADTIGVVGWTTSLVLDSGGSPVISYYDSNNGDLKVLHCRNAMCSGSNSIFAPDMAGNVGGASSLALDVGGRPVVAYYDVTNFDLRLLHCGDASCSLGNAISSPDTVGIVGRDTSLAMDGSGNPVIAYSNFTTGDLKLMHCNDPNCAGGDESVTTPDAAGDVGHFVSLVLDTSGNPVVSYVDTTNPSISQLKLLHCNDPQCAGGDDSITTPDTQFGGLTSLELDPAGNPVVSYYALGDLKVLHCDDPDCAAGGDSIVTADGGGGIGSYNSLALDAAGNPVVSYYDANNSDLKVLHCDDPDCAAGGNTIASPDTEGDVGKYPSLALDSSGNPVTSYYDSTDGVLKVLQCANVGCAGASKAPAATPTPSRMTTPTRTPVLPKACADVNDDGRVNSLDAAFILQFSAGILGSLPNVASADPSRDGQINSVDSALILQRDAGLINRLIC